MSTVRQPNYINFWYIDFKITVDYGMLVCHDTLAWDKTNSN